MREYIVALAKKLIGTPYIWGGSTPRGFDCSGFIIWIFQVFGVLPAGDWTADGLAKKFKHKFEDPRPGDLVCYGTKAKITHITIYVGNGNHIGASGGGSKTTTEEIARQQNAMVKEKPVNYRKDFQFFCDIEREQC